MIGKTVQSLMDCYIYDVQGATSGKIEIFKNQVVKIHQAMKFNEWASEEQ